MAGSAVKALAALVLLLVAAASQAQYPTDACPQGQRECYVRLMENHDIKRASFWKPLMVKPIAERIRAAPQSVVQFLAYDNLANGYPNKPRQPNLSPEFMADVMKAYNGIPEKIRRKVEPRLVGIFFVEDLGGTGFTDVVYSDDGRGNVGFIALDPAVLTRHTGNAWSTWKDGTPFKPDGRWKLESRIAADGQDDRVAAIQYILLHEIAHVLALHAGVHPSWALKPSEVGSTRGFEFFNLSWLVAGNRYASKFDVTFQKRKDIAYYFGARLEGQEMVKTYESLEKTNFPTLYAATHPGDDFAESFVNYVHVVMMGKPFEVRLSQDGRVAKTYKACWGEARCAAKRAYLEQFLR